MAGKKQQNKFEVNGETATLYVQRKDKELKVLIDAEDLKRVLSVGKWHAIEDKTLAETSYYIANRNGTDTKSGIIKLHRFITGCPREKVVDHINHDTLDNRKVNLRVCTHFENQQNLRNCKSGIPGVYLRSNGKWVANISKNNKRYYFETKIKENAIKWRQDMINKLYKEVM